jgi:hypothetical protein
MREIVAVHVFCCCPICLLSDLQLIEKSRHYAHRPSFNGVARPLLAVLQ